MTLIEVCHLHKTIQLMYRIGRQNHSLLTGAYIFAFLFGLAWTDRVREVIQGGG